MVKNQTSSTLQQKKYQARSIVKALIILGVALLIGIGTSNLLKVMDASGTTRQHYSGGESVLLFVGLIVSLFLVLLTHECGHLSAGLLQRCRFELLIVGPLKIARENGKISVGLNKSLALAGGIAATSPEDTRNIVRRFTIIVLSGPLASLALAGVLWVISLFIPVATIWRDLLQLTSLLSLLIFLVTALPLPMGTFYTDGARVLMLMRKSEEAKRWTALISLQRLSMGGQPPMYWNAELLHQATALNDASMDNLTGCWLSYYAAIDRGDEAWAGQLVERLKLGHARATALVKAPLALDIAYFVARYQHDAIEAENWYAQSKKAVVAHSTLLRTEAALALSQGELEEARAKAEEGLQKLTKVTEASTRGFEERRLNDLLQQTNTRTEEQR